MMKTTKIDRTSTFSAASSNFPHGNDETYRSRRAESYGREVFHCQIEPTVRLKSTAPCAVCVAHVTMSFEV
jgi:hypothetical protein